MSLMHKIPFLSKGTRDLGAFGIEQAKRRVALTDSILKKDLFYYLVRIYHRYLQEFYQSHTVFDM